MTTNRSPFAYDPMTCDSFLDLLPDLLEGELTGAPLAAVRAHEASCARCRATVEGLEAVTTAAAALPPLSPSRDLWAGIAERIDTPVVPLGRAPAAAPAWFRRPWLAAAAVLLLVGATAFVTHRLTLGGLQAPGASPTTLAVVPAESVQLPPTMLVAGGDSAGAPVEVPSGAAPAGEAAPPDAPAPRPAAMQLAAAPAGTALEAVSAYDDELAQLRTVLDRRRESLDTATVRVLETNLDIIDRAILDSRAALARDPASRFLNEQLTNALQDKLQLMRTMVLISND